MLHQADWIACLFSSRSDVSDESNALKTGYGRVARCWPAWLAATPLLRALLPDVVASGSVVGTVGADAARRTGLPAGTAVVAGCTDFLGTGAGRPGDGVTALGTTMTLKLLSDAPVFAPAYGIHCHRIGEFWLTGGASNGGGVVLADYFPPQRLEALSARHRP